MWINRDFLKNLDPAKCLESVLIRGPRQIGKTSILLKMQPLIKSNLFLDDVNDRNRASQDPEFIISQLELPTLVDEIQRAPEILFSIKKQIDRQRRVRQETGQQTMPAAFRLTGSNQTEIDQSLKESLAGRVSIFRIHGLSLNELLEFDPAISLRQILFRGGFPELWIRPELNPVFYLNDYISTFIEKDIARTAGVEKLAEFSRALGLLAARVGELLNFESVAKDAGVSGKAVKEWVSLLERNGILYILKPYFTNLNKRIIKMPKAYFIDSGICVRLQAHQEMSSILSTPQAGHLFENLVVAEVIKIKDHFMKDLNLFFWRTKEKEEIDLIVESDHEIVLLDAKLGTAIHADFPIPPALLAKKKAIRRAFVTAAGERKKYQDGIDIVPISDLTKYILNENDLD